MSYNNSLQLKNIISGALKEDIGRHDITTDFFTPQDKKIKAVLLSKQDCVICGLYIAGEVFRGYDSKIKFTPKAYDGQFVKKGSVVAKIEGPARSILSAERVSLNFLSLLCGIATKTRKYVDKIKPYKVKIVDTRKTIPGLRALQKYAVRIGGAYNHRFSLDEMIMVKDNHLKIIKGCAKLKKPRNKYTFEVEVSSLREFRQVLGLRPDVIMLDNMPIKDIKKAVSIRNNSSPKKKPKLEVSGGINLSTIRRFAATGVDIISVGDLTHSVESVDLNLEIL